MPILTHAEIVNTVAEQFGIGRPFRVELARGGCINVTFFVDTPSGEYVLQQLHSVVRPETCEDAYAITVYVRAHGFPCPQFLMTKEEKPWYRAEDGSLWRVMTRLHGETREIVRSPDEAHLAAKLLGKFHVALVYCSHVCRGAIPHFHDTPYIFEHFSQVIAAHEGSELLANVAGEVAYLMERVPREFLPPTLPRRIVHGDPGIVNFLFQGSIPIALIDFDTCMNHTPLVDIGDALRSWCNAVGEDEEEAVFDNEIYGATVDGYLTSASLSLEERALIPQAFRLITIEQAVRFLNDYFEDSYFGWSPERFVSRRAHNLVRTHGQLSLYRQIVEL